jgi:CRP-like cAMP-binding protein
MNAPIAELLGEALRGRGLDAAEAPALLRYGAEVGLRPGRQFAWQGDEVDRCLLVLTGRLAALKNRSGAPPLALPAIGRGEWACLAELVAASPAQADYAAEEESVCLGFSSFNLRALRDRPGLERWISLCLARGTMALHAQLASGGPRERIAAWLLSRRRSLGGVESAAVAATQAEIARCLGLSRETVNKRLAEFEAAGLVATGRAAIRVPDWEALERTLREE